MSRQKIQLQVKCRPGSGGASPAAAATITLSPVESIKLCFACAILLSMFAHLYIHDHSLPSETLSTRRVAPGGGKNITSSSPDEQRRFSLLVSLDQLVEERGVNPLTTASGCHLAAWVFQGKNPKWRGGIDCYLRGNPAPFMVESEEAIIVPSQILDATSVHQIEPYDTVYVNIAGLEIFANAILPNITQPIVLIAHNWFQGAVTEKSTEETILANPYVVKLFISNMDKYWSEWAHPKVTSWPYGIMHTKYKAGDPIDPVETFRTAFMEHLHTKKTNGIYRGWSNKKTNREGRNQIQKTVPHIKPLPEFYKDLATHRYVLSPNGDRPECYRHYEAIGLGAIPMTELSNLTHPHFLGAPIVYGMKNWDDDEEQLLQHMGLAQHPTVNRMMALEEYWIGYVQNIVGRNDLRWFDRIAKKKSKFEDFQVLVVAGGSELTYNGHGAATNGTTHQKETLVRNLI